MTPKSTSPRKGKSYKPRAFEMSEGDGFIALYCPTKEIACKKMQEEADDTGDGDLKIKIDKIQIQQRFYCRHCQFYTLEEPICIECGENLSPIGRKTFVYYY